MSRNSTPTNLQSFILDGVLCFYVEDAAQTKWLRDTFPGGRLCEGSHVYYRTSIPAVAPPQPGKECLADLPDFARRVKNCASRLGGRHCFGDDKVYIASIWHASFRHMSLEDFKAALFRAHKQRLLRLARADLVARMDRALVADSEIQYLTARFHFVLLRK